MDDFTQQMILHTTQPERFSGYISPVLKPRPDSAAESPTTKLKHKLIRTRPKIHEDRELSHKPLSSRRSVIKKVGPATPEVLSDACGRQTISFSHVTGSEPKDHFTELGPENKEQSLSPDGLPTMKVNIQD